MVRGREAGELLQRIVLEQWKLAVGGGAALEQVHVHSQHRPQDSSVFLLDRV